MGHHVLLVSAFTWTIACGCGGLAAQPGAVGDGDAGGGRSADAGTPSYYGFMGGSTQSFGPGSTSSQSFVAEFCLQDAPIQVGSCARPIGSCCLHTAFGSAVPPQCTPASAGTLQITAAGAAVATLSEQDGGYATPPSASWPPGATLTVVASGAEVPAFQVDVPTPRPFAGLTPLHVGGTYFADRTQDLAVRWTPDGRPGESVALLVADATPNSVSCEVNDAAGEIVIPAQALALFGSNAQVSVYMWRTLEASARQGATAFRLSSETSLEGGVYLQ